MVITFAVAVRRGTNSYGHARGRSRGSIRAVGPRSVVVLFPARKKPSGKNRCPLTRAWRVRNVCGVFWA